VTGKRKCPPVKKRQPKKEADHPLLRGKELWLEDMELVAGFITSDYAEREGFTLPELERLTGLPFHRVQSLVERLRTLDLVRRTEKERNRARIWFPVG
jgi:hypothetical protein